MLFCQHPHDTHLVTSKVAEHAQPHHALQSLSYLPRPEWPEATLLNWCYLQNALLIENLACEKIIWNNGHDFPKDWVSQQRLAYNRLFNSKLLSSILALDKTAYCIIQNSLIEKGVSLSDLIRLIPRYLRQNPEATAEKMMHSILTDQITKSNLQTNNIAQVGFDIGNNLHPNLSSKMVFQSQLQCPPRHISIQVREAHLGY